MNKNIECHSIHSIQAMGVVKVVHCVKNVVRGRANFSPSTVFNSSEQVGFVEEIVKPSNVAHSETVVRLPWLCSPLLGASQSPGAGPACLLQHLRTYL